MRQIYSDSDQMLFSPLGEQYMYSPIEKSIEPPCKPKEELKRLQIIREKKKTLLLTFEEKQVEQNVEQILKQTIQLNLTGANEEIVQHLMQIKPQQLQSQISQITKLHPLTLADFYSHLWTFRNNPSSSNLHLNDICPICQFPLFDFEDEVLKKVEQITLDHLKVPTDDVVSLECGHYYHLQCLEGGFNEYLQCAICCRIFGQKIGDQPDGEMICQLDNDLHCEGYYNVGTIIIDYQMWGGIRNGIRFNGTRRICYLPDTTEGRQVLRLLKVAFQRKLIFTVGRSITNGMDNQTVWNGIHHKTKVYGGSVNYGWPDDTYFLRVRQELACKGVL